MDYNYEASLNLRELQTVLFEYPLEITSKRYKIPLGTLKSYRAKLDASNYRDWKGISIKKAIEILAIEEKFELLSAYSPPAYVLYPDPILDSDRIDDRFLAREIGWVVDIPERDQLAFQDNLKQVTLKERKRIADLWQTATGRLKYTIYSKEEKEQAFNELDQLFIELANKYHFKKD